MNSIPLGKWLGIPVYLHWTWVVFLLITAFFNPQFVPLYVCVFFLVILHELGHCMMARQFDVPAHDITLYPIGGVAKLQVPFESKAEFCVAAAGPGVNLALSPLFFLVQPYSEFLTLLGYYNIALLVFNIIPALPMDGGRMFRAFLVWWGGKRNYVLATTVAARVSQGICACFVLLGIWAQAWMLVIIAIFIAMAAQGEITVAKMYSMASYLGCEQEFAANCQKDFWKAQKDLERRLVEVGFFEREQERRVEEAN